MMVVLDVWAGDGSDYDPTCLRARYWRHLTEALAFARFELEQGNRTILYTLPESVTPPPKEFDFRVEGHA